MTKKPVLKPSLNRPLRWRLRECFNFSSTVDSKSVDFRTDLNLLDENSTTDSVPTVRPRPRTVHQDDKTVYPKTRLIELIRVLPNRPKRVSFVRFSRSVSSSYVKMSTLSPQELILFHPPYVSNLLDYGVSDSRWEYTSKSMILFYMVYKVTWVNKKLFHFY